MKTSRTLLGLLIIGAVAAIGGMIYASDYIFGAGPMAQSTTMIFKRGQGFQAIGDDLAARGVITQPELFEAIAFASGNARRFKAGEYNFPANASPREIMQMMAEGRVVVHKLTVPEGLTVRDVTQIVMKEATLEGDVPPDIKEGSLLPETYRFVYGDKRKDVIARMQTAMNSALTELWAKRKEGLPLATPQQALTLASIVEKETGVTSERGRVAAVFINRLRKGMKLQTDPTVAYGLEQKKGAALGRSLTLDDLRIETPYNTYIIDGLPPSPIANPGRAALEATLNPPDTSELYFVATGTGGHNFSSTLEAHNRNVQAYRGLRNQKH